jgi:DNA polymerase
MMAIPSASLLDTLRQLRSGVGGEALPAVSGALTKLRKNEKINPTSLKTLENASNTATTKKDEVIGCSDVGAAVFCDFETRNTGDCKLKPAGAWRYAADPATEILTLTFRAGGEYHFWAPAMGLCDPLSSLAADPAVGFISHAGFEQAIWQRIMVEHYGFAPIPIVRWHDTQAVCAYHALPLDLDRALSVLGSPVTKDKAGRRLVLSLARCNPKTGHYPEITPEIQQRVAEYNHTDVAGLVVLDNTLGRLPKRERRVWELDQRINQRGLGIDLDFVQATKALADRLMAKQSEEFQALTGGLNPTQVLAIRSWLAKRGLALPRLDENAIEGALRTGLPPEIRRVLEIRAMIASTSLKKLDSMLACVGSDGRARGLLQYHGATPGRWTGRLLQPQNFPRPVIAADPEELVAAVKTGELDALRRWGEPIDVLVSGLRHALVAQNGAVFGAGDFATIEACIVLALAGQDDKVALLASGADAYRDMAADIFGLDKAAFLAIDKGALTPEQTEQRQIGKNTVLGSGFGLGHRGFYEKYCRHIENGEEFAERIIKTYREVWAPKVPLLWTDLEWTALQAMYRPGTIAEANCGIRYRLEKKAGLPFLICQLLNGTKIHYANAAVEQRTTPWGDKRPAVTYWAIKNHHWRKVVAWYGVLTENVVQALARELLVAAMFRFEECGFPVVLTVHDEIVVEHPAITEERVKEIMPERPGWASLIGLPIAVEAWVGKRYRK